jgi:surface carbohydrate biosynthesis protein
VVSLRSRTVLLPVEIKHRELDAMLLLGAVLAERGRRVILGNRQEINGLRHRLPPALVLGKTIQVLDEEAYERWRRFGHGVVALDEEALVMWSKPIYVRRRVHPPTVRHVAALLAWGRDNALTWEEALPAGHPPIHLTGNARFDLLRPELRPAEAALAAGLRRRYGRFILFNSNFGSVNAVVDEITRLPHPDQLAQTGQAPPRHYDPELARYRHAVFAAFRSALPAVAHRFPGHTLIVRPHPSERAATWQEDLTGLPNAQVVYEHATLPWILAAEVVLHHTCTTAVEAYLCERPAISYRPLVDDAFDPALTVRLSEQVTSLPELLDRLAARLEGARPRLEEGAEAALAEHYAAATGPLAAERIADALDQVPSPPRFAAHPWLRRRRFEADRLRKRLRRRLTGKGEPADAAWRAAWRQHLYPSGDPQAELAELRERLALFGRLLGRFGAVQLTPTAQSLGARQLYRLERRPG